MSSVDQVSALSGGAAFAALWRQVAGDSGAVGDLASALRTCSSELDRVRASVTSSTSNVHAGWQGQAAGAFDGYMSKVKAASSMVGKSLDVSAGHLDDVSGQITTAKSRLTAIADRALDAVAGSDATTEAEKNAAEAQAVDEAVDEARPVVQELSAHLQSAASRVRTALKGSGFLGLGAPGDRAYLPAHGGPIDWSAVPRPGHGTTSPASGGSGGGSGDTGGGSGDTGGGSSGGGSGGSGGPPDAAPKGDVKTWIDQAIALLEKHGVAPGKLDAGDINTIIEHESGGNPHAENLTDSNAAAGHPSKGLMQTIDSTFDAHALPGHHDVWNPVDNIVAGVRYALSRYGSLDNVPGVAAVHSGGTYVGY